MAVGWGAYVADQNSSAIGRAARVDTQYSMSMGDGACVTEHFSCAFGSEAKAQHRSSMVVGLGAESRRANSLLLSARNREEGTRVWLELVAGRANGTDGEMMSAAPFMEAELVLTCRDELNGLEDSMRVPLARLFRHLLGAGGESNFEVVESGGNGYGNGYGYGY